MQFNGKTMTVNIFTDAELAELRAADQRAAADIDALEKQVERFITVTGTYSKPVIIRDLPNGTYHVRGYLKLYADASQLSGWQHLCQIVRTETCTYMMMHNAYAHAIHHYTIYDTYHTLETVYLKDLLSTQKTGSMYGTLYMYAPIRSYAIHYMNNYRIANLANPVYDTDAATKQYVDNVAGNWMTAAIEEGLTT